MSMTLYAPCLLSAALLCGGEGGLPEVGQTLPTCTEAVPQPAKGKIVCVTYPVADLVVPVEDAPCTARGTPVKKCAGKPACTGETRWGPTLEDRLLNLITSTVAPDSWSDRGGPGTIQYFPLGMALVIRNTQDVQEQVADLLAALRRLQDVEVAVEIRLVKVSEAFFRQSSAKFGINARGEVVAEVEREKVVRASAKSPLSKLDGVSFLDEQQVRQFLEAAQGDKRYSVLQAPKMTVFSGQRAFIHVNDTHYFVTALKTVRKGDQVVVVPKKQAVETGLRFLVQPAVSADRRYVRMNFRADLAELDPAMPPVVPVITHLKCKADGEGRTQVVPVQQFVQQPSVRKLKVDKSFVVADGKTAVVHWGQRVVEGRNESGPPVLSEVPYLGRMFRNVGYARETETLVLLITPRVVINEEQEEIFTGELPPIPQP